MTGLSEADVACLATRQLFTDPDEIRKHTIGIGRRCRHGWPQALLSEPFRSNGKACDMVWVTCPLLAAAIEEYEKEGALQNYSARAVEDEAWRRQVTETHEVHHALRQRVVAARQVELQVARARLGDEVVDLVMGRGLDLARNSSGLRCLHAHAADHLVRGTNMIGRAVLEDLAERGVEVEGTDSCAEYCGMAVPLEQVEWTFCTQKQALRLAVRKQIKREGGHAPPTAAVGA